MNAITRPFPHKTLTWSWRVLRVTTPLFSDYRKMVCTRFFLKILSTISLLQQRSSAALFRADMVLPKSGLMYGAEFCRSSWQGGQLRCAKQVLKCILRLTVTSQFLIKLNQKPSEKELPGIATRASLWRHSGSTSLRRTQNLIYRI